VGLEFGILGPLQVLAGGRQLVELVVAAPSQRALLAVLLLRPNQVVTIGQLIEDLWGPTPPARAEAALRVKVSRLRRLLGQAGHRVLVTRPGGYLLRLETEQLDAGRFERLAAQGQQALAAGQAQVAAERLAAALGLWRGPVLADVPAISVVVAEQERLAAVRVAARLSTIEADQALGRHGQALTALKALAAEHPLDEGVCGRLLRALCHVGRQVEALAVYRGLRRRLVDELGVEPSAALQELERQILAGDPELQPALAPAPAVAARPVVPTELPADVAGFTGRRVELARLEGVLAGTGQHGPVVSAVQGAGGVGKSALAIHAAHRLAGRFPDGQVYVNLQGATPGLAPLGPLEVLGRLLRSLGVDPAQVPTDTEEAAARWRSLVAGRRLLLVLDNARDAAQVRPLLPASPTCTVLITSRQALTTLEGAQVLHLDLLPRQQAVELLGRVAGPRRIAAEPEAAAELARCCGYLPLALRIAGARLAARPGWPVSVLAGRLAAQHRRLDELATGDLAVRASFEVSLHVLRDSPDPLDQAAAAAFGLLGLPDGPDLDALAAARLLQVPPARAEGVLERLADAQLLQPARPGRYQFHDLLRLYAREHATQRNSESQRAAALTRLLGYYTATAWHTLKLLRPGDYRLATADPQWTKGGLEFPDEQWALRWLEAERANLLAAIAQAATLVPAIPAELAGQLTRALHGFFAVRSYLQDDVQANRIALDLARRTHDQAGQAHALNDLGLAYWQLGRYDDARDCHQQGLGIFRELGNRRGQATSLNNLGGVFWRLGKYEEAIGCYLEGLAIDRELGDRHGQAASLTNLGLVYERLGRYEQAIASQQESLALFRELDDRDGQSYSLTNLGDAYERLGRYDEALACQRESLSICRQLGNRRGEAYCLTGLGLVYERLGRHEQAIASQQESIAVFRALDDRYGQARALRDLGDVLQALGRRQQARATWQEALQTCEALGVPEAEEVRARLAALPSGA
jgi:DNA-binding SARP family transcriptional activator/tetratricopeptide (TPR) repeat protein